jgi:hypothetical protein
MRPPLFCGSICTFILVANRHCSLLDRAGNRCFVGSDQIAEIAPGVREVLIGGRFWCATFRISRDPYRWVQFTAGTINAAYPHHDAPEPRLGQLGSFALSGWAPNRYITGLLALEDARSVARWIDNYFVAILGCDWDYSLDLLLEPLRDAQGPL